MEIEDIKDVFQPYEKLIELKLPDATCLVPENNSLLRCFQYLSVESISFGDFCWNGDCLNCQVTIRNGDRSKSVIACRTIVQPGMEILEMSDAIELEN